MTPFAPALVALIGTLASAQAPRPDYLAPVRFMVGDWQGAASGEPGSGTASRHYAFALKGQFLHERNTTTYPPQEQNKAGEVHEHWSFFSYDKQRKAVLFRQFHQEGFVLTYALNPALSTATKLVFESEQVENIPSTWKARETYELTSGDAFTETFEIAQPGQPFTLYSQTRFTRRKP